MSVKNQDENVVTLITKLKTVTKAKCLVFIGLLFEAVFYFCLCKLACVFSLVYKFDSRELNIFMT